jgi:adenylate cyclase
MVNFTEFTRANEPKQTVSTLDDIFTRFDAIAEQCGLEKIKTIGDCYMAVAGLPDAQADHAKRAAEMALDVKRTMLEYRATGNKKISFRIGIDCGPVVAGVIGSKKFIYDLWGEAVNTASRMESTGVTGEIHCTDNFRMSAGSAYSFTSRGIMEIKGIGPMETWLLQGRA